MIGARLIMYVIGVARFEPIKAIPLAKRDCELTNYVALFQ